MWNITEYETLPSTNVLARELLAKGEATHGDVIQAYHQTEGRGRFSDRKWEDKAYHSVLISIIFTKPVVASVEVTQFHTALVIAKALRRVIQTKAYFASNRVAVKWPNDLLIDGKKCAGILVEAVWSGEQLRGLIIGIGINVNQIIFNESIAGKATSIFAATGESIPLQEVRNILLEEFEKSVISLQSVHDPKQVIIEELRKELEWMKPLEGLMITESDLGTLEKVQFKDITEDGALIILDRNSDEHVLRTAHVVLPSFQSK